MQKCKKCSNKFRYKIILKSIFSKYSPITCEGCDTQYYVNFSTRIICVILILFPLIIRNFNFDIYINTFASTICYLLWVTVVLLILPFFARYHTKNK
jgi:CXXC-20-CXXC protein